MQKRCSSSRQPHHKKGGADLVLCDFRMQTPVALQQEPVAQNAKDIGTQRDVSDHIQVRIPPARLKQAAKWFAKITLAEIVKIGAAFCDFDQVFRRNAAADLAIKHRAKSVEGADDDRWTETIDGGGRLHWADVAIALSQTQVGSGDRVRSFECTNPAEEKIPHLYPLPFGKGEAESSWSGR